MAEQPLETDNIVDALPKDMEEILKPADVPAENTPAPRGDGNGPVVLRDRFVLDTAIPLPHLDSPSARAYQAEDRRDLGRKLFVLICSPEIPTRIDSIRKQKTLDPSGRLDVIDWDVVFWPPLGQSTMAIIFTQPLGGRIIHRLTRKEAKITE